LEYFPVEDLKPGMKGITYTVLQGSKIDQIETEVLGVARGYLGPGHDLIICKLVDPKTALTGAVHGMSGSPLFIDGKMVGALSRRIATFEKDGHCGFTPIRDMLEINQRVKAARVEESPQVNLLAMGNFVRSPARAATNVTVDYLGLPMSVTGLKEEWLNQVLQKFGWDRKGFVAMPAGGKNTGKILGESALQPGAPVAAVMMTGDVHMAGTGTLTWREGNRVLGFGHPMFGFGETRFPMANAEIISTIASYMTPYKLSNTADVVGTISQDRLSAIGGLVGALPKLAHYEIERIHDGQKRRTWQGELTPIPELAPMLLFLGTLSAWMDTDDFGRIFSARIEGEVRLKGHSPLRLKGVYGGEDMEFMMSLYDLIQPLLTVYGQAWEKPELESFHLKLETSEKASVWNIESIQAMAREYEPGQKVEMVVELRERWGEKKRQVVSVTLPENIKSGSLILRVAGAEVLDRRENYLANQSADSVDQLINQLNRRRTQDQVYVQVLTAEPGQMVKDQKLTALPDSVRKVMGSGNTSEDSVGLSENVWSEDVLPWTGVVTGYQTVSVKIKN
jgi:hypothetical protein